MYKMLDQLNSLEKRTFYLHLSYIIIHGFIEGVFILNEFVLFKSLHGSSYQVGMLFQFTVAIFIFLFFINEFIRRTRNKKRLMRKVALITRSPLVLLIFFPTSQELFIQNPWYHYAFLFIFFIYFMGTPVFFPLINLFLKKNYRHSNFGKLFGYASSARRVAILSGTFIFGLILDIDQFAFVYFYPCIAFLAITSIFLLSKIEYEIDELITPKKSFISSVIDSTKRMLLILKKNKPYKHFEIGFMLYGFAFMSTASVTTIYFEKVLELSYSGVAFYKNVPNFIAIILLPIFGKLIGKIDPRKFAIITYVFLGFYMCFLAITEYFPFYIELFHIKIYFLLVFAIIFYGFFTATMSLLWNIGSAYFCKVQEAGDYQSVHLSLTGVRGIVAPIVGITFYEMIGFTGTYALAVFVLLIAIHVMLYSRRNIFID